MKKIIKNGKILTPSKIIEGNIVINEKGKIEDIDKHKLNGFEGEVFDAKGNYILPGLIEVHGHLREPGMSQKEDVPHGTRAALAGGYTTIIDMPNTKPPTVTVDLLKEKINSIYPGRAYTDYAFFMGASRDSLDELKKVDKNMIVGVKVFMAGHETTPTTIPDDVTLGKIFQIASQRKLLLAVHAEDQSLINYYAQKYKNGQAQDPSIWSKIRPKEVIVAAVARAISLAEQYGTSLYLLHLSTPEEFALVMGAKQRGTKVYGELVGYQLVFTIDDYKRLGNKIKVAPALRTREDQDEMWKLVREEKIDVICSEHTPHEWETKNQLDVWTAQSGTPGLQETLPALITKWLKRFGSKTLEEGLMKLTKLMSLNPARIFGFKSKGAIEKGKDADLTIIDIKKVWTVKKENLFSKCGWSAYEGMKLVGRPVMTFLRGNLMYREGEIIQLGQWLKNNQ
ncbi:dihydroorotase family protein [Candidatus Roizmanbacteria bacterium]|nr:dihydroorotase family protein [Candidatus Roizmanbacteria bacterium]